MDEKCGILQRRFILPAGSTIFTHQLETLFKLTPSYHRLQQNQNMLSLFNVVNRWAPKWRYVSKQTTGDEASFFIKVYGLETQVFRLGRKIRPRVLDPSVF